MKELGTLRFYCINCINFAVWKNKNNNNILQF